MASFLGLSLGSEHNFLLLHQVLFCDMYVLLQLYQFEKSFQTELANKKLYKASIGRISLRLAKFQESDKEAQRFKTRAELKKDWKDANKVLHYQRLLFISEIFQTKLISCYYNDFLAGHFSMNKIKNFHQPEILFFKP